MEFESIESIEKRIESLFMIKKESDKTVTCLNRIVANYISARNAAIEKGKTLQDNINRLNVKLDKLKELKSSKIK